MEQLLEGCTSEIKEHNRLLLEDYNSTQTGPSIQLPPFFILEQPDTHYAVLISTEALPMNVWKFHPVRNPSSILLNYIPKRSSEELFEGQRVILVQRKSSNQSYNNKLYKTLIWSDIIVVQNEQTQETIPVLRMTHPHTVLSSRFSYLGQTIGDHWKFPFVLNQPILIPNVQQIQTEALEQAEHAAIEMLHRLRQETPRVTRSSNETMPTSLPSLPQHIINIVIERAIEKGEKCPITLEILSKQSMVVTPCGHGLDNSSAKCWIVKEKSCPVCRQPCSEAQLQGWSA